ncbi:MAG: aldehyde dehydrogenase family protein, partial [Acidobacteriota bacterium]
MASTMTEKGSPGYDLRETRDYQNFIDGEWVASSSSKTFENRNPANTSDLIGTFQESNAEDVDRAVQAAHRAFLKWRLVPGPRRGELIYRVAEILKR